MGLVLFIELSGANDRVAISRVANEIRVTDLATGSAVPCANGTPTVFNTDSIAIDSTHPAAQQLFLVGPETFTPGFTDEEGTSDEIEIHVDLGADWDNLLALDCIQECALVAGSEGINVNATESNPDVDVTFQNIAQEHLELRLGGGPGEDFLSSAGGAGTGSSWRFEPVSNGLRLDGRPGNDEILGGDMYESLRGGAGNDVIDGGPARDRLETSSAPGGVNVNLTTGIATGEGTDTLSNIEDVDGTAFDDVLIGHDGDSSFLPMGGNDTVDGRGGRDILYMSDHRRFVPAQGVVVNLSNETGSGQGQDTLRNLEVVYGTPHDDTLVGDQGPNELSGLQGDDTVDGRRGADQMYGYEGVDTLTFRLAPGGVTVRADEFTATGFGADTFQGFEVFVGSRYGDELIGSFNIERILGLGGPDVLQGRGEADVLFGGIGADKLQGGVGDDSLSGQGSNDTLNGGPGSDRCVGGAGTDVLRACET